MLLVLKHPNFLDRPTHGANPDMGSPAPYPSVMMISEDNLFRKCAGYSAYNIVDGSQEELSRLDLLSGERLHFDAVVNAT